MAILMGGRAAERLVFDDVSSGAADDLEKATGIARSMVTRLGMDETIGNVSYAEGGGFLGLPGDARVATQSPRTADAVDQAVHDLIEAAYQRALTIVKIHHVALALWAEKLLAHETLDGEELAALRAALVAPAVDAPAPPPDHCGGPVPECRVQEVPRP
jgi:cell division protease FtsH